MKNLRSVICGFMVAALPMTAVSQSFDATNNPTSPMMGLNENQTVVSIGYKLPLGKKTASDGFAYEPGFRLGVDFDRMAGPNGKDLLSHDLGLAYSQDGEFRIASGTEFYQSQDFTAAMSADGDNTALWVLGGVAVAVVIFAVAYNNAEVDPLQNGPG